MIFLEFLKRLKTVIRFLTFAFTITHGSFTFQFFFQTTFFNSHMYFHVTSMTVFFFNFIYHCFVSMMCIFFTCNFCIQVIVLAFVGCINSLSTLSLYLSSFVDAYFSFQHLIQRTCFSSLLHSFQNKGKQILHPPNG